MIQAKELCRDFSDPVSDARSRLLSIFKSPGNKLNYRAVDRISFIVPEGSVLGIVGRNGAGKSTLLKILGGLIQPTSGELMLPEQVQSLLNLSLGLHQELTGNENLIFQAVLLGMSLKDAQKTLPEMQKICGLEEADLRRPVKHYSDGMRLRIAFAASIVQKAELWLVDEVLGVGDASFFQFSLNCLMNKVFKGMTLIAASHDLNLLSKICTHILWLERGEQVAFGDCPVQILEQYANFVRSELDRKFEGLLA